MNALRFAVAALLTFVSSAAYAEGSVVSRTHDFSTSSELRVGLLWNSEREADAELSAFGGSIAFDQPMDSGLGLSIDYAFPVSSRFTIGPKLQFETWLPSDVDDWVDAGSLVHISVVPKILFPLQSRPLAFYLSVPVGVTAFVPGDDMRKLGFDGGGGANVGAFVGVEQVIAGSFGVYGEAGIKAHSFTADLTVDGTNVDFKSTEAMVTVQVGGFFAF